MMNKMIKFDKAVMVKYPKKDPDPNRPSNPQSVLTPRGWTLFMQISNYTCTYCRQRFDRKGLVVDHIIPVKSGGRDVLENFICACSVCNAKKRTDRLPFFYEGLLLAVAARRANVFRGKAESRGLDLARFSETTNVN